MAVFSGTQLYVKEVTGRVGIGALCNTSTGQFIANTGVDWSYSTVDPNGILTARAGSICSQSNGTLWLNTTGAMVWISVAGATVGWNLPDDVVGSWGTTSPLQEQSVYVSASARFDLRGIATTGVTASIATRIATGLNTVGAVVVGGGSGALELLTGGSIVNTAAGTGGPTGPITISTGASDANFAGAVAGATGALNIGTGNSTSTIGTSASTGAVNISTGNSDDANSGKIALTTGTAAGTRGVLDINIPTVDLQTQATAFLLLDNTAAALIVGSTGATNMLSFDTSNGAEEITLNATGAGVNGINGIRALDNIAYAVGTAVNDRFRFQYAPTEGQILGTAITAGGATQATRPLRVATGARTLTDAAGSPGSGAMVITTGAVNVSFAGGAGTGGGSGAMTIATGPTDVTTGVNTGGPTGAMTIGTGNASSTIAGTSGSSGALGLSTGTSEDASTGALTIATGNATAAGAVTSGALTIRTGTVGGTGTTGDLSLITGNAAGAGLSGNIVLTVGSAPGGIAGFIDVNSTAIDFQTQALNFILTAASTTALQIGSAAAGDMMVFNTTATAITFREGGATSGLTNLHIGVRDNADGQINAGFFLRKTYGAGASTTDVVLPARTGGWRIVDVYIISGGATGGSVTVQTAGGGANVSDAMVPSALGAGGVTRCLSLLNNTFASGATVRLAMAAMAPAGEAFIRVEPL